MLEEVTKNEGKQVATLTKNKDFYKSLIFKALIRNINKKV